MWYAGHVDPQSPGRHVALTVSLTGAAGVQSLRRCLRALVARHEALRTVLAVRDHRLSQTVQEYPALQVAGETSLAILAAADRVRPAGVGLDVAGAQGAEPPGTAAATASDERVRLSDVTGRVLALWREILDAPGMSVDDDFFASGGHSLEVARVASRVLTDFGVDASLQTLFEHPTVTSFSAAVAQVPAASGGARPAVAITRASDAALDVDALLDQVEQLSGEEIERLLRSGG